MQKTIYYLKPSSFCFWVERAIKMLDKIIMQNPNEKIYCIHEIVHNPWIVKYFEDKWIIFVESFEEINDNNSIVCFSAHWVNRETLEIAQNRFKKVCNLECPLVTKVYRELESFKNIDTIFYIWKTWHQEAVWLEWYGKYLWKKVYVFSEISEIPNINKDENIWVLSQTTLNFEYVKNMLLEIKKLYKNATLPLVWDICKATYERQSVIINNLEKFQTLIVIWWKTSSNTKELYKIWEKNNKTTFFWENLDDIEKYWENELFKNDFVAVTGWASTPESDIKIIIDLYVKNGYKLENINL